MSARFEVVRTAQGWHSRFRAKNGRVVWVTENYDRRKAALNAIACFIAPILGHWVERGWVMESGNSWTKERREALEIRDVDEREQS